MFSLSVSINFNKRFFESNQIKNAKIVEYLNDSLNYLNNFVNRNEIPEIKNPNKTIGIVEKPLNFNKQQKSKRLKILTHKQCC